MNAPAVLAHGVPLGTIDELPEAYRQTLEARSLVPLWPFMRNALPHDIPHRKTRPHVWEWADVRPNLLRAGELTPIEKAERRVLILENPGLAGEIRAAPAIFIGMQLILPGETAPTHKHSPSAVRMVIEGKGGYTIMQGEKCPMEKGDLILTPSGMWHEHGHEGTGPVIWMDALDLPTLANLECSYAIEGGLQNRRAGLDSSQNRFVRSGLIPYDALNRKAADYPLVRFPWKDVRAALEALATATAKDGMVHLAYVNPETGAECMPVLGFSAIMLRPGETARPARR